MVLLRVLCMFFCVVVFGLSYGQSSYPVLEEQVKQGEYKKAYNQAIKLRVENEGDPRFDYLYGLAALQTGHYDEAVYALERVTISTPYTIRPRLELARAYLKLENRTAAVKEFNDVLNLSPPPIVRSKVLAYIAKLKKPNSVSQKSLTKRLVAFSIGYDDNINFGSDNDEIDLPGFGIVNLDPSAIGQESGFAEAKFQLSHRKINNRVKSTFFVANLTHRSYFKNSDYDYSDLDLRTGITLNKERYQYQLVIRDRPVFLDSKLYNNTMGIDAILRKSIGNKKVIGGSLTLENYDNKQQSLSDRQRVLIGGKLDAQSGDSLHQYNLYLGKEWPDEKLGKPFSRNIIGLGYKATREWNSKNKSFLSIDYRHYKHLAPYPVFPDKRSDDRFIVKAVHELKVNAKAAILFSARHIKNKSNLDLYDATRNEVKVGIRYEWD